MQITTPVKKIIRNIINSIAFYPSLIALVMIGLAIGMVALGYFSISKWLAEHLPFLNVNNADTARTILSTVIAGIISLTVFSFSMVMVLLNQAATNFSPRLLPGLISDKKHQLVLGFYMGTIIYCVIVLMNILPDSDIYSNLGLSVAVSILLSIICLALFAYFIHTISHAIQINNILEELYHKTRNELQILVKQRTAVLEQLGDFQLPDTEDWPSIESDESGYLQAITEAKLLEIAEQNNTILEFCLPKGQFVLKGLNIVKSRQPLGKKVKEQVLEQLLFDNRELIADNYLMGFKQITEIAVKAMSPGINDPGTALNAIDYLTELLSEHLRMPPIDVVLSDSNTVRLIKPAVAFKALLYPILASLRQYCKHDVVIVLKLLSMLKYLLLQPTNGTQTDALVQEVNTLLRDIKLHIKNEFDYQQVQEAAQKIQTIISSKIHLEF